MGRRSGGEWFAVLAATRRPARAVDSARSSNASSPCAVAYSAEAEVARRDLRLRGVRYRAWRRRVRASSTIDRARWAPRGGEYGEPLPARPATHCRVQRLPPAAQLPP